MLAYGIDISKNCFSAVVQAEGILFNISCIFIISNSNRHLLQADQTQNTSTAESRFPLAAT